MIGAMAMPANFQYKDVFIKGYPQHERYDSFRLKHPTMDYGRRAKIFSPFDALKGFSEAVAAKEIMYEFKRELGEEEVEELSRKLNILHNLTYNGRMARAKRIVVTVTYYVPCTDKNHEAFGYRGQYINLTGVCWRVDSEVTHTITVGNTTLRIADITDIQSESQVDGESIFDYGWEAVS